MSEKPTASATSPTLWVPTESSLAAKADPENHGDIIVRVCGFSAPFVCLGEKYQDEIIARNTSAV